MRHKLQEKKKEKQGKTKNEKVEIANQKYRETRK
jgi:hypothetical protein